MALQLRIYRQEKVEIKKSVTERVHERQKIENKLHVNPILSFHGLIFIE